MHITIEPAATEWAQRVMRRFEELDEAQRATRAALGLPSDVPVIMTGHQAELWHPGILAKMIAAQHAAHTVDGAAVWLIVDQDVNDCASLRIPVREPGQTATAHTHRLGPEPSALPTGRRPPLTPEALQGHTPALQSVQRGVDVIERTLSTHADAPSVALQMVRALEEMARAWARPAHVVSASALVDTPVFRAAADRMREDPASVRDAYNVAVATHPDAGIAPLTEDSLAGMELPLWVMEDSGRRRAFTEDLAPGTTLAPRALLMTGLLRSAACDFFIHGTGGGAYDAVTEAWFRDWLGVTLAPTAVVTADLYLPISEEDADDAALNAAKRRAHEAKHDPSVLGDAKTAAAKRELLRRIEQAKAAGDDPRPIFGEMQRLMEQYRTEHAAGMQRLQDDVTRVEAAVAERELAADRTWAFPLHEPSALDALDGAIKRAFAGQAVS
jgi:hypothetical protein